MNRMTELLSARTATLEIAYETSGPMSGLPVVLLHGFPYDPRAYDQVVPTLASAGCRVLVPYLRGFGPTRFVSAATPRSGQQAALGKDLVDFLDVLSLEPVVLVGYDWGGRAACIVAALWPGRVRALVTVGGYNIQDIAGSVRPAAPEQEHRLWYQYYFHSERGRAGLAANRFELCRLLWRLWSPTWSFSDATYARSAVSFDNPDFVEVVIQSYRHRFGYAPGDPALGAIEAKLAAQPVIPVPTINLAGADDGVSPLVQSDSAAVHFTGPYTRRVVAGAGHNLPQEKPGGIVDAVLELLGRG
jgi:pimeloyl-ACP methyl ester carboxylesterase